MASILILVPHVLSLIVFYTHVWSYVLTSDVTSSVIPRALDGGSCCNEGGARLADCVRHIIRYLREGDIRRLLAFAMALRHLLLDTPSARTEMTPCDLVIPR